MLVSLLIKSLTGLHPYNYLLIERRGLVWTSRSAFVWISFAVSFSFGRISRFVPFHVGSIHTSIRPHDLHFTYHTGVS